MEPDKNTFVLSDNDRNKVRQIYEEYYGLMYHIAKQKLGKSDSANDAVSANMEKLIFNLDKIEDVYSKKTKSFIVVTIKNTLTDILRKQGKIEFRDIDDFEIADKSISVSDEVSSLEGCKHIIGVINLLPNVLRSTALLSFRHELSNHEISKILDVDYDTVRKRLQRAKAILRGKLKKESNGGRDGGK